jgi:outer membrane protein assembly factor BamB
VKRLRPELSLIAILATACGSGFLGAESYDWLEGGGQHGRVNGRAVQLRWRHQLRPSNEGAWTPVERASAALDPRRDRVYVGSSAGELWAFSAGGQRVYSYDAGGGIGARPALDARRDELYVATDDGVLHRLRASSGELVWREELGGAVTQPPILTPDAVYVVTDNDIVIALAREDGEALWRYRRDAPEGFYVSQHAGITMTDRFLLTAFTAGVVVALDPADGSLQWERDTAAELEAGPDGSPRFADVDTTPVVIGDTAYIASFAGGLYALEVESGTVRWRDETLTGIIGITPAGERLLVMASGDLGVVCFDRIDREILWRKRLPRGAPGEIVVAQDLVMFGESQGGFVTLALQSGRELGRIETGHGFTAPASVVAGRGFVVSNGGSLLAFALPGAR